MVDSVHARPAFEEADRGECINACNIRPHHREAKPRAFDGITRTCVAKVSWPLRHTARCNGGVAQGYPRDECGVAAWVHHANAPANACRSTTCGGDVAANAEREVLDAMLAQDRARHADCPSLHVAGRLEATVAPRVPGIEDPVALCIERVTNFKDLLRLGVCIRSREHPVANAADLGVRSVGREALFNLVQPCESRLNRS